MVSLIDSVTDVLLGRWQHHRTKSYHSRPKGRPLPEACDRDSKSMITESLADVPTLDMMLPGHLRVYCAQDRVRSRASLQPDAGAHLVLETRMTNYAARSMNGTHKA